MALKKNKPKTFHTSVQYIFLLRLPFLSRMTSFSRFYFQTFYSKMKLPWLKRTFLCHHQSKYFSEDYRHDNWDDSGQAGKRCLFWTAGRVDRKNLPLKMHLTWKMVRYLRRPNCTAWNQYVTVKSVLKFTWLNWSTPFCTFFSPCTVSPAWLSVKLLPTSSSDFFVWHMESKEEKSEIH